MEDGALKFEGLPLKMCTCADDLSRSAEVRLRRAEVEAVAADDEGRIAEVGTSFAFCSWIAEDLHTNHSIPRKQKQKFTPLEWH